MTTLELLQGARALLEKGWIKHRFEYGKNYCIVGALNIVDKGMQSRYFIEAIKLLEDQIPRGRSCQVMAFNDEDRTTHQEVLSLMDRAISKLSGKVFFQQITQRAHATDLIQHEEKDNGIRQFRPFSVFDLYRFSVLKAYQRCWGDFFSKSAGSGARSARRESAGVEG